MVQGDCNLRALASRGSLGKDDIILLNFGIWFHTPDIYAKALTAFKDDYETLYLNRFTHNHATTTSTSTSTKQHSNYCTLSIHTFVEVVSMFVHKTFLMLLLCTAYIRTYIHTCSTYVHTYVIRVHIHTYIATCLQKIDIVLLNENT